MFFICCCSNPPQGGNYLSKFKTIIMTVFRFWPYHIHLKKNVEHSSNLANFYFEMLLFGGELVRIMILLLQKYV